MAFESTLNLLWVCLGVSALGTLGWSEFRFARRPGSVGRLGRALSVLLAVVLLFPCVSASDDLLTVSSFQFTLNTQSEVGSSLPHQTGDQDKPGVYLARFFDSLQNFQIAGLCLLAVAVYFLFVLSIKSTPVVERYLHAGEGRAPPVFASRAISYK